MKNSVLSYRGMHLWNKTSRHFGQLWKSGKLKNLLEQYFLIQQSHQSSWVFLLNTDLITRKFNAYKISYDLPGN